MPRPPTAARAPKLSEAAVQKQVLKMLAARERLGQLVHRRRNTGAMTSPNGRLVRFGKRGDSDIHGTLAPTGRTFHIEVKGEGWKPGKPGPAASRNGPAAKAYAHWLRQWRALAAVNHVGGLGVVVTTPAEADWFIEAALKFPKLLARVGEDGTVKYYTGEDE